MPVTALVYSRDAWYFVDRGVDTLLLLKRRDM